jgi:hypothetical protein
VFSRYPPTRLLFKLVPIEINALDETGVDGGIMDLSEVIIVMLGILFFFGGAAWLEIHSRKNESPVRQGAQLSQSVISTMTARRTV